ncbi:hypothetical protein K3759_11120 [Sulfitobacter sp. W027]|uniref:hypothetical protein n=1 Tax=Sulfitobacter sp. W027 TaxID=2867025 RepID=UPI0021A56182|nr:hypothetical protein [Sulfitobacter sp. W027]UWR32508.1 hypothetical protein K3759_11120 [Sulfitobacter sp. W027]
MRGNWVWSRDGEEVGRIGYSAEQGRLTLSYRFQRYGEEWESIKEAVHLSHADCHYGNQRPYFLCPGVLNGRHCGRRVGKLFLGGRYFLCRHCCGISYASQSEPRYDRMLRRANKLRVALGGEPGTVNCIAPKPKGMWHRTYQRKRFEIEWCEHQADRLFIAKYAHLLTGDERALFDLS